ncbi:sensor histidine kinase [uncultured Arcticibacterium sp.]|uniref:sensor histidine kinase n=1 Tax=uncultured Arcticibacterium sp. TaxID=2173042 RepID=UPI0030F9CCC9
MEEKKLYYDSVYNEAVATGDNLLLAEAYYLYGKYYNAKRDYKTCLNYFFKALRIHEKYPPSYYHGRCLTFIGNTYIFLNNPELAWHHFMAAEKIYKEANSKKGIEGMPNSYFVLKLRFPDYYEKNKSTLPDIIPNEFIKHKDQPILSLALFKVQELIKVEQYRDALKVLLPFDYIVDDKDPGKYLPLKMELAFCYMRNNQLALSEQKLKEAAAVLNKNNFDVGEIALSYHTVAEELYRKLSQWKLSHYHLTELKRLELSRLEDDRNGSIAELTLAYEDEKKTNQIEKQASDIKEQRTWLILSMLSIVAVCIISFIFYQLYQKNKRLADQNKSLLKEQNHRVKNNLQILSSLLKLQGRRIIDVTAKKQLDESQLRIETMALIHQKLHQNEFENGVVLTDFFHELIDSIFISFNLLGQVEKTITIEFVALNSEQNLYLSLIVNELVTNACKYAWVSTKKPMLGFQLKKIEDMIHVSLWDNGGGVAENRIEGFGTKLISMQTEQLDGRYTYSYNSGTHFEMKFPI